MRLRCLWKKKIGRFCEKLMGTIVQDALTRQEIGELYREKCLNVLDLSRKREYEVSRKLGGMNNEQCVESMSFACADQEYLVIGVDHVSDISEIRKHLHTHSLVLPFYNGKRLTEERELLERMTSEKESFSMDRTVGLVYENIHGMKGLNTYFSVVTGNVKATLYAGIDINEVALALAEEPLEEFLMIR